jgi:hypothetical protein
MTYVQPDNWVVLKITHPNNEVVHKVLAGFYGGYLHGNSWRLNSGITKVEVDGDYYLFHGNSGSIYKCHKDSEHLSVITAQILNSLLDNNKGVKVEMGYFAMLEEDTPTFYTEEEILESYWPQWKEKMIKKYGEDSELITKNHCIEDWIVENWAWKTKS